MKPIRMLSTALPRLAGAALLAAPLLHGGPAAAQSMGRPQGGIRPAVNFDKGGPQKTHQAPPSALPGSQANPPSATPAGKDTADLQPNDALFDAINRGDVASARDALGRGADLGSHNVLGMSPLELSVDLGRNDISFLLLSLRGADGGGRQTRTAAAPPPSPAPRVRAERTRDRVAVREARALGTDAPAGRDESTAPAMQRPKLFAGNGGAPKPQAGFLGFDTAR